MQTQQNKALEHDVNQIFLVAANLRKQKKYAEAEKIYAKVLKNFPTNPSALFAYGNNLNDLGKPQEARKYIQKAIQAAPNLPVYHMTLVTTFINEGEYQAALRLLKEVNARFREYIPAQENLLVMLLESNQLEEAIRFVDGVGDETRRKLLSPGRALAQYLLGKEFKVEPIPFDENDKNPNSIPNQMRIFGGYLQKLAEYRAANPADYNQPYNSDTYIVGDSHTLSAAFLTVGGTRLLPRLVMGAKAWHLNEKRKSRWFYNFKNIMRDIPKDARVVFNFGEIDCRINQGLFKNHLATANDLEATTRELVAEYTAFLGAFASKKKLNASVNSVPAPQFEYNQKLVADSALLEKFTRMIKLFNSELKAQAASNGLVYNDIYEKSLGQGGLWAKEGCHIDSFHYSPALVKKLFETGN